LSGACLLSRCGYRTQIERFRYALAGASSRRGSTMLREPCRRQEAGADQVHGRGGITAEAQAVRLHDLWGDPAA